MKLLIITQKVDRNDDVLGFFHSWIAYIGSHVEQLDVIALSVGDYTLSSNIHVFSLGKEKNTAKFFQAIKFYWYLLKILPKVDGIFVHMAPEYVRALYPINVFFGKPIFMWYAHIKVSSVAKWAIEKVRRIFTPSKESFSIMSDKVIASGHGVDTKIFQPLNKIKSTIPIILTISRLSRVKRINVYIEAIRILKEKNPGLVFKALIVGEVARQEDSKYVEELRDLITKYDLDSIIEWKGSVKNIETPVLYNEASAFVRLQGGGGFGKTELEAMACGTPVILCTDVYNSLLGEFSKDLYFPEDNAEKCAENIANVLGWDGNHRKSYASLARNIVVRNHNIENLAKQIVSEFDKVLKQ